MNDFTFMKKMNEEDAYLFKRCIRKMLDTTFIVADKDEKLYDFISSESNQYDVNTYLAAIGYKVVVEERMKVAMLQQADEDVETVGLKRINLYRFDAKQVKLLMVLWLLFLERMGYADPVHYSDDITTEEGKVRLYPSLQFCMDIGQLKQVMAEYALDGEGIEAEQDEFLESEDADE